jgi:cytochrome c554/c'-like protein
MTRADLRAWLGVVLAGTVLAYVGCSTSKSTAPGSGAAPPSHNSASAGAAAAKSEAGDGSKSSKLLANWPKPRAVLVITGQMDGYLEPCGCTQPQQGGLIRRLDFVDRLRAQNWPMALIDLGGLIKDPTAARGGFDQAKIKFGIALKAYQTLGYQAIALSAEDLKVGIGEAFGQFLSYLGEPTKIVVANVQPGAGYESHILPSRVITAGSLKLGVTAVVTPEALAKLADADKSDLLPVVKRPDEVLGSVLADLESKSDYQVLMVQASPEEAKRLALAYPGFDVVVAKSPSADPLESEPERFNEGKTMMVQVGRRGKNVGAIGFYPDESPTMRFHLVNLGSRYDGPGTAVKKVIEDEYRNMLKGAGTVETFPRHDFVNATAGSTYVGAETCKNCHPNTYMKWSTTKHAQAFTALLNDPKPNTIYDAECVTCHTTGFEYTSGYRSATATPYLKGNQCENCHGPASKHVSDPANAEYRKPLKLTAERADKSQLCIHCHDEDNSPKFEFATFWGQIAHKGLDDYKDPKVRRGITPKVARTPAVDAGK